MKTNETVRMMTLGQLKDLIATVGGSVPTDLTQKQAQAIVKKKELLVKGIRWVFAEIKRNADKNWGKTPILCPFTVEKHLIPEQTDDKKYEWLRERIVCKSSSCPKDLFSTIPKKSTGELIISINKLTGRSNQKNLFGSMAFDFNDLAIPFDKIGWFLKEYAYLLFAVGRTAIFLFKTENKFYTIEAIEVDNNIACCIQTLEDSRCWSLKDKCLVIVPAQ